VDTAWKLGDARAAAGDEKGAQEAYDIVMKEGRRGDHRTLALFFAVKNRNADEAVQLAKDEMEVRPNIYTHDAYAWALYRKGMLKEAREQIDQATALGTKDATLLYHAGAIRIAAGDKDKDEGEKLVRDALALNPKFDPTMAPEAEKLVAKQ
jgi:tetratricopeptide (TPR) repeat protein